MAGMERSEMRERPAGLRACGAPSGLTDQWRPMVTSSARALERALEEKRHLERALVATEPADDLHAERKAILIGEARHVDAGRAHQGPQPIEDRLAGRLQAARRRARRRRREDRVDTLHEIRQLLPRAASDGAPRRNDPP